MADGGLERQLLSFGLFCFLAHLMRRLEEFLELGKHLVSKRYKSDCYCFMGSTLNQKHSIYIRTSCERADAILQGEPIAFACSCKCRPPVFPAHYQLVHPPAIGLLGSKTS
jgi:hypothetical protein